MGEMIVQPHEHTFIAAIHLWDEWSYLWTDRTANLLAGHYQSTRGFA